MKRSSPLSTPKKSSFDLFVLNRLFAHSKKCSHGIAAINMGDLKVNIAQGMLFIVLYCLFPFSELLARELHHSSLWPSSTLLIAFFKIQTYVDLFGHTRRETSAGGYKASRL